MGPVPVIATVRLAVRRALADVSPGELVLVACSGGADSLALASAAAFAVPRMGLRFGGVTIDHGLQDGSAARAEEVVRVLSGLGASPVESIRVTVGRDGGPEAAARTARYLALDEAASRHSAAAVLLGHTLDDQAETVLLGLARGSGARSLAGMPSAFGPGDRYRRPFLDLNRASLASACSESGLTPWRDPHNADPAYTRARVRHTAIPALAAALGPGTPEALARTAKLLREDTEALDAWAEREAAGLDLQALDVQALEVMPTAVRRRVIRLAALAAGCPAGTLAAVHIEAVDALVTAWRGQGPLQLPGGVGDRHITATRRYGRLYLGTDGWTGVEPCERTAGVAARFPQQSQQVRVSR